MLSSFLSEEEEQAKKRDNNPVNSIKRIIVEIDNFFMIISPILLANYFEVYDNNFGITFNISG